jgi:hypothetical protein
VRIILLNWSAGENDPFSYFNQQFQRQLAHLGHEVHIVPLDELLGDTLCAIQAVGRIDLVFTWQGLGSAIGDSATGKTVWEQLNIPLVCLHGDHPCHNPLNHQQSSRHVLHVYLVPSFQRDANRLISRDWPALFDSLPNFITVPDILPEFDGEYFVLPKNFTDHVETRRGWRQRCDDATYRVLCACADAIEQEYLSGSQRDHHEVMLDQLPGTISERVRAGEADAATAELIFQIGRELDHVYRSVASAFVLQSLPDVPIHVYGRGWERFVALGNPLHVFRPAERLGQNDSQFASSWGIIDIAPINQALHDRTLRAMRRGAGFLLSSAWRRGEPIHDDFSGLFYSGSRGDLPSKIERIRRDPEAHRREVRGFSDAFDTAFPMTAFLERACGYARERGFRLSP